MYIEPKHKAEEEDEELGLHFDDEVDDDDDEEGEYAGIYGVGPNDGSDDDDGENEYYKQVKSLKRIKREKIQQEKQVCSIYYGKLINGSGSCRGEFQGEP